MVTLLLYPLLGCGLAEPVGPLPDADEAGDEAAPGEVAEGSPDPALVDEAVRAWAADAPALAVLDVLQTQVYEQDGLLRTEALLGVVERVEGAALVPEGGLLLVDVPGGMLGDRSTVSSDAPLLFADDRVLARLRVGDEGLQFDGHRSVLPVDDDQLVVCVNPAFDAVPACLDQGAALLFAPDAPRFAQADSAALPTLSLFRTR